MDRAWIAGELRSVDLGDERLDRRFALLLDRLCDKPSLSIPAACRGLAETMAAYRFFRNNRVNADSILQPHYDATIKRMREQPVVLVAQDTTEIDLTRKEEMVGGPLSDASRWGVFAHTLLATTPERVALGVVGAAIWSRDEAQLEKTAEQRKQERRKKPMDEKESYRWLQGYRTACNLSAQLPQTTVVSLSDSEGDIYECFVEADAEAPSPKAEWIVRACQNRTLMEETANLFDTVACTSVLGKLTIAVSKREASTSDGQKRKQARSARKTKVQVRATRVLLHPPWRGDGSKLPPVYVNAVLVREEKPPPGEPPVEWLLLTRLPIACFEEVVQIIDWYCCRWEIEIYFRVLKSGCRVEELQLEAEDRIASCVALYMIVAWRVLYVLMLGREYPNLPCDVVLEEAEWKAVYMIESHQTVPATPPALGMMVEMIAGLGGWLGRKNDGPPGPQTMWIGLQRVRDFALAWNTFGPKPQ